MNGTVCGPEIETLCRKGYKVYAIIWKCSWSSGMSDYDQEADDRWNEMQVLNGRRFA